MLRRSEDGDATLEGKLAMSNQSKYYFAENLINGFGKTKFLQVFHRADTSAGADLVGSIVDRAGPIWGRYPVPFHMTKPQALLGALQTHRGALSIAPDDPIVQKTELSGLSQSVSIKHAHIFQTDLSALPNIPLEAQFLVDYERITGCTFNFQAGARVEYIPTDYLSRLHRWCDGNYRVAMPDIAVKVDREYIVDQVLIAKNVSMQFSSKEKFDTSIEAKVKEINASVGGKAKFGLTSDTTLSVSVLDNIEYLVGLKVIDWDSLG